MKKFIFLILFASSFIFANAQEQVSQDTIKVWHERAEQGDVDAQFYLGECYYYGRGVEKSLTEAKKWYQEAAAQGYEQAQQMLDTNF